MIGATAGRLDYLDDQVQHPTALSPASLAMLGGSRPSARDEASVPVALDREEPLSRDPRGKL